jgi:hypothetical protein
MIYTANLTNYRLSVKPVATLAYLQREKVGTEAKSLAK